MKTKRFFLNLCTIILSTLIYGSSAGSEHPSLKHHSAHDSIFVEKIVFRSDRYGPTGEICIMNPDGSDLRRLTTNSATDRCPTISPDGKKIAFTSNRSGNYEVYIMNTDGSNPQRLTNSPVDEAHTDWHPDGSKIAFSRHFDIFTSSNIFVINIDGSNEQQITNSAGHNMGPHWSADGTKILFNSTRDGNHEIYTMNADGSNQQRLLFSSVEKTFPRWSPDGSKITYSALNFVTLKGAIHVMNADGTHDVAITTANAINEGSRWSPDGSQIVFQTDRDSNFEIYTMNIDGSNLRRLTNHRAWDENPSWGVIQIPDTSSHPTIDKIAFNSDRSGNAEIFTVNISGNNLKQVTNNTFIDYWPSWSSDGSRIAYSSVVNGNCDIYVVNQDGTGIQRLTHDAAIDREPAWSFDGTRIAFESGRDGNPEIYTMNADGTNNVRLTNNSAVDIYAHWSPDCQKIAFCSNREGNFEIYSMNADGSNPMRLTNNASNDWTPKWSPDGKKIAFVSERDGNREIYVMNPDGSYQKRITDHPGTDIEPDWSYDGLKMVFVSDRNGNQDIYMAELSEEYDITRCIQITTDPSSDRHPVWQPRKNPTSVKEGGQSFHSFPQKFQLFQNYPNPFNSDTTIRYHLSQPGKVRLQIFDTMGRLVHTLIDHQQQASDYQIRWDGTDNEGLKVSTGVYLCQLTVDEHRLTNKLILIK